MTFAMLAMVANIMFYGQPPAVIEESVQGGIILNWDQFRTAVMAFLISAPPTFITIAMFYNVRPREKSEDNYRGMRFSVVNTKT